jgi:ABC-type glycerol-3-phosphate transport system substrate-binding protein
MKSMIGKIMTRRFTRRSFLAGLGATAALPILAACEPQVITEEKVVVVEKEVPIEKIVTQVVEKEVQQVVTVEVEKAVEVERVVTVEVEKAIEVVKKEIVEVEKEVIVEREKVVTATMAPEAPRVTLSYWTWWYPWGESEETEILQVFEGENPGWTYEVTLTPWTEFRNALRIGYAGGERPDFHGVWNGSETRLWADQWEPLQDALEAQHGLAWTKRYIKPAFALPYDYDAEKSNFVFAPAGVMAWGLMFYNLAVFDKFGVKPPDGFEMTYDELVDASKAFKDGGIQSFAYPAQERGQNGDIYNNFLSMLTGPSPWALDQAEAGELKFTDPVMVEALANYRKMMIDDGVLYDDPLAVTPPEIGRMRDEELVAMFYGGSIMKRRAVNNDLLDKWRVMAFPQMPGTLRSSRPNFDVMYGLAAPKEGDNKDGAIAAATFINSDQAQKTSAKIFTPAVQGFPEVPTGNAGFDAHYDYMIEMMAVAHPRMPRYQEVFEAKLDAVEFMILGSKTPQEAMQHIQDAFDSRE